VLDAVNVLDGSNIERAHIVGLSMGGFTALHLGLNFPHRARSLVVGGCGYGAEKEHAEYFKGVSQEVAQQFESLGSETFARTYAGGAARVQFQNKDPRGWEELVKWLSQHSSKGAANTMRGVQAERPSLYDLESGLRNLDTPTLVINGDEDDHCLQPGLFLKRTIPACGLLVLPKTGHTINLEEPNAFNSALAEFFAQVEADQWSARDPPRRSGTSHADPLTVTFRSSPICQTGNGTGEHPCAMKQIFCLARFRLVMTDSPSARYKNHSGRTDIV